MTSRPAGARSSCLLADAGMVSSLGSARKEIREHLLSGDQSRFSERDDLIAGLSRPFGQVLSPLPEIPASLARYRCRNNQISLLAYESIRGTVEASLAEFGASRVGIVVGSSTAGVAEAEDAVREHLRSGKLPACFDLKQLEYGGVCEFLQAVSGARGPCYALSTACSTGAKALVSARGLLDLGLCDAVIAGAVDSLCQLTANGFHALQALSPRLCNPMSCNRDGMTLGEGAALFVVTRDAGEIQLLGAGESSDAHHMSAPAPDGRGAEASMRSALADSGVRADEVAYLNLHGTATPQNDAMESVAVSRVFPASLRCSSTKPLMGHALGASGALEAAVCWSLLADWNGGALPLPPHRFDGDYDCALPKLELVGEGESTDPGPAPVLMTNSFGFGGSNCALVLGRGRP